MAAYPYDRCQPTTRIVRGDEIRSATRSIGLPPPLPLMRPLLQGWPAIVPVLTLQHRAVVAVLHTSGMLVGRPEFIGPDRLLISAVGRFLLASGSCDYHEGHPLWCWIDDGRQVCHPRCTTPGCPGLHVPPDMVAVRAQVPLWRGAAALSCNLQASIAGPTPRCAPGHLIAEVLTSVTEVTPAHVAEFVVERIASREVVDVVEGPVGMDSGAWYRCAQDRGMPGPVCQQQQAWLDQRRRAAPYPLRTGDPGGTTRLQIESLDAQRRALGWQRPSDAHPRTRTLDHRADDATVSALTVIGDITVSELISGIDDGPARRTAAALLSAPGLNLLARLDWARSRLQAADVAATLEPLVGSVLGCSHDRLRTAAVWESRKAELRSADARRGVTRAKRSQKTDAWL